MVIKYLAILCVGVCIGWLGKDIYLTNQRLTCSDYTTKHAIWQGFMSIRHGDVRCFWLEDKFPWRVRQGVPIE